jgi:outer membrane protein TolC
MHFKFNASFILGLFLSISVHALIGADGIFKTVEASNQEVLALQKNSEAKQASDKASISGFLPTLSAVGGWQKNTVDDPRDSEKGYNGYLEGKLNIFRGFKDQSFSERKELDRKIANIELEMKKREVRAEITQVLGDMISLHKLQAILQEELSVNKNQKQMAQKKVSAGLTSRVDNLEFELRESEILLEQKQIDQEHDENHQKFFKVAGTHFQDTDLTHVDFSPESEFLNLKRQMNLDQNLDYQKANLYQSQAEIEKSEIRSDFLPTLDFTYAVGRLTPTEEDSFKFNESKYGVQLTIPLFSGFETYYKTKSVSLLSQSFENTKNHIRNVVNSDFEILSMKLKELTYAFQINEKKISNTEKYYNLTLAEYKRGIKNSPDLVSATERYFSAKKKKLEILKTLEILKVKIENF